VPLELVHLYLKLPVFALVAARLTGLLLFQPVLGSLAVPVPVRALLIIGLAALITPLVPVPPDLPDSPTAVAVAALGELLLGVLLGLAGMLCFYGLQLAGLLLAQESGLAYGQVLDPTTEEEDTVLGAFYLQLGLVLFLVLGGHRVLVSVCLDTFRTLPLLAATPATTHGVELLVEGLTLGSHLALRVAAPALLALFLVNVALGFISRTMPQLNVLAVGFSLKSLVTLLIMAAALPAGVAAFVDATAAVYNWLGALTGR